MGISIIVVGYIIISVAMFILLTYGSTKDADSVWLSMSWPMLLLFIAFYYVVFVPIDVVGDKIQKHRSQPWTRN